MVAWSVVLCVVLGGVADGHDWEHLGPVLPNMICTPSTQNVYMWREVKRRSEAIRPFICSTVLFPVRKHGREIDLVMEVTWPPLSAC